MSRANLGIVPAYISYSEIFWDEKDGQFCFYIKFRNSRGPKLPDYRVFCPVRSNVEFDLRSAMSSFPEDSEIIVMFDEIYAPFATSEKEKVKILAIGKRGIDRWARLWNGHFPAQYQQEKFINCDIRPDSLKIY